MIPRSCLAGALVAGLCCSLADAQTLGPPFTIRSSPTIRSGVCDIAYDLTRNVFGLVFGRADGTIRIQLFRGNGSLHGNEITLGSGLSGRIANVNVRNRFVVCWQSGSNVLARIVDPVSGALSSTVTVATSVNLVSGRVGFDIGGEATTTDDGIVVVWCSGSRVHARQVTVTSSFQLQPVSPVSTVRRATTTTATIRVSRSGGPSGRYLLAWTEANGTNIFGAVITRNMTQLDTSIRIDLGGSERRFVGGIDGDGRNFVVAYQKRESASSSIPDVFARSVTFDPANPTATFASPERAIEADPNDSEHSASVAFTGSSALVSYIDRTGSGSDAYAKSVEPFACHLCEPQFSLDSGNSDDGFFTSSIALRAGGANNETALVVWTRAISGGGTTIRGRFYFAEDGISRDVGGGCGTGGETFAACARPGHAQFSVRLRDATGINALLVLSPRRIDVSCGFCMLVPDPVAGSFISRPIGASGGASAFLPIPSGSSLIGTKFYAQWLVPRSGAPCAAVPAHFSNALEVEIQ